MFRTWQQSRDRVDEILGDIRLRHESVAARLRGLVAGRRQDARAHHDDPEVLLARPELTDEVEAAAVRQADVQEHEIDAVRGEVFARAVEICGLVDDSCPDPGVPGPVEDGPQQRTVERFVLHVENPDPPLLLVQTPPAAPEGRGASARMSQSWRPAFPFSPFVTMPRMLPFSRVLSDSVISWAVRIRIGRCRVAGSAASSATTPNPSSSGMSRSQITRS